MPKLVNLKMSKKEMEAKYEPSAGNLEEEDRYPWGLRISLDDETVAKLEAGDMSAGQEVQLVAKATVRSVMSHDSDSRGKRTSLDLQITDMALDSGRSREDQASSLYES